MNTNQLILQIKIDETEKNKKLADLMTKMEKQFSIPALRDEA